MKKQMHVHRKRFKLSIDIKETIPFWLVWYTDTSKGSKLASNFELEPVKLPLYIWVTLSSDLSL